MFTYIKRYIALLLPYGILTQCELLGIKPITKPETLPPITQEGKNIFGCYINGNLFLPRGKLLDQKLYSSYNGKNLQILVSSTRDSAGISIGEDLSFNIYGYNITNEGTYRLDTYPYQCDTCNETTYLSPITYLTSINGLPSCYFDKTNHDIEGTLIINKINNVAGNFFIAGTFEFTLTMKKAGGCTYKTLKVTQGRFDLK